MRWLLLVTLTACWTGTVIEPEPEPAAPKSREHVDLAIKFKAGACFGACPTYEVTIASDGLLHYRGSANVVDKSEHTRRLTREQMLQLSKAVDHVEFFQLDESGHEPQRNGCTTVGNTTSCSFGTSTICSDTSHTVITVERPRRRLKHTIDDAHCTDGGQLVALEQKIEELVALWVAGN